MRRARRFWPDLVTRIFQIHANLLQVRQCFFQSSHVWQMERHVTKCSRGRFSFVQGNGDIVISDGDTALKLEFLFQTKGALEPFRTLVRIAHRQAEVTDYSKFKRDFHGVSLPDYVTSGKNCT